MVKMASFGLTTPDVYIISFDAGIDVDNGVDAKTACLESNFVCL